MESKNKKKDILDEIQDFERNLHFKGSVNLNTTGRAESNIIERLGFTTSMNSVVKDVEQGDKIKVLSPFSQRQEQQGSTSPMSLGVAPLNDIAQSTMDPVLKRTRFLNSWLIKLLLLAIAINFILIFIL
ncbi:MAG: hypothetical protein LUQ65_02260 [Candidatus Helarchaeota archaeon]|nr:hypothetical protein [Candidatus Helarchaeota archaeon]